MTMSKIVPEQFPTLHPPLFYLQGPSQARACFILWVLITFPSLSLRLPHTAVAYNNYNKNC